MVAEYHITSVPDGISISYRDFYSVIDDPPSDLPPEIFEPELIDVKEPEGVTTVTVLPLDPDPRKPRGIRSSILRSVSHQWSGLFGIGPQIFGRNSAIEARRLISITSTIGAKNLR